MLILLFIFRSNINNLILLDGDIELLPPRCTSIQLSTEVRRQISYHLKTQFSVEPRETGDAAFRITNPTALKNTPAVAEEWGKLRILNDGDTIHAFEVCKISEDQRDATFIRVSCL